MIERILAADRPRVVGTQLAAYGRTRRAEVLVHNGSWSVVVAMAATTDHDHHVRLPIALIVKEPEGGRAGGQPLPTYPRSGPLSVRVMIAISRTNVEQSCTIDRDHRSPPTTPVHQTTCQPALQRRPAQKIAIVRDHRQRHYPRPRTGAISRVGAPRVRPADGGHSGGSPKRAAKEAGVSRRRRPRPGSCGSRSGRSGCRVPSSW
jgi:hypothetical protein